MVNLENPYKPPTEKSAGVFQLEKEGILEPGEGERLSLMLTELDRTYSDYLEAENKGQKMMLRTKLNELLGENLKSIVSRLIENEVSSVDLDNQNPNSFSLLIITKPNINDGTNVVFRVKPREVMPPSELIRKMLLRFDLRKKGKIKERPGENMYLDADGWFRKLIEDLFGA